MKGLIGKRSVDYPHELGWATVIKVREAGKKEMKDLSDQNQTNLLSIEIRGIERKDEMLETLWPVSGLEDPKESNNVLTCGIANHD